ncbi:MAG TPA: D-alanyl-D-alanine carboxypeptidase, partial [Ktedonobacterales bacterium]|nr:D-alanyl-D-alanine carboxypeptidase [Ktedonobacterales bacterium]
GATGVKTGSTGNAGECLVFSASRDGRRLIGVLLNDTSTQGRFADAVTLLDWGFGLD